MLRREMCLCLGSFSGSIFVGFAFATDKICYSVEELSCSALRPLVRELPWPVGLHRSRLLLRGWIVQLRDIRWH